MESWFAPTQPGALPAARKVLVLAPHPDDEVFGCGGAIALYAQQAVPVHVHILTDGAGYAPQAQRAQIRATRQQESRLALARLGSGIDCDFGPYQDRALLQEGSLIAHMVALLEQHAPGLVIAPSPWEIHPDHQACARAAAAAVALWQRRTQADVGLMLYEIGSPLRPNLLLDITAVWEAKEQAMQSFASQLEQQDYIRHVQGLNSYRTYTLPPAVRYAEAYQHLSGDDLAAMHRAAEDAPAASILAARCMDHWVESALQSASVHAEGLQQALRVQTEHSAALELQRDQRELQHEQQREQESLRHQQENQVHLQENLRLHLENQQLQQHLVASENALRHQLLAHEQAAQALQGMHASTSWRITAPLRMLGGWLKR